MNYTNEAGDLAAENISMTKIFEYIFVEWLPDTIYELDNRPHFEILGEKYKNNDPDSEEDLWIPIRDKKHE